MSSLKIIKAGTRFEWGKCICNDHGMAPGMGLNKNGKVYILLPGPPKEMKPMYVSYVEPFYVTLQQEKTFILACFASSELENLN